MLPPRWIRRAVLAPVVPLMTVLLLTSIPLSALVAAAISPLLPGRWRPLRLLLFVVVLAIAESLVLLALLALWVATGFGHWIDRPWSQRAHYALMRGYLGLLVFTAHRAFRLRFAVEVEPDDPLTDRAVAGEVPLIVLSRHAGPGDSFLLVHGLLKRGLKPRIVLHDKLQWAPGIDIALNRIPSAFVGARRTNRRRVTASQAISSLAGDLGPGDALVLFPEGRNFTAERRIHSIARLEELGRHREADQARTMRHVLTPRPGGALAAIRAAPAAEIVFVGHTGLENLSSLVDLWRGLPMDAEVKVRIWRVVRAGERAPEKFDPAWLLTWWRHIDAWIVDQTGVAEVPDAIAAMVDTDSEGDNTFVGSDGDKDIVPSAAEEA